jgi:hypothetical protein
MKHKHPLPILLVFCTLLIPTSACLSGSAKPENDPPTATPAIALPSQVTFCKQKIELDRLDLRERFDREITAQTYLHSTTLLYIKRANRFFPIIEPILKKNNIPDDFKYLAVIESGLDTRALSPARAAGLWQFMEQTARQYGLEIRDGVDERYHISKATEAACQYFNEAYQLYGNWIDVAASYNAGMARITTLLRQQRAESTLDLLLVAETSRYLFRIIAAKEIFENPKKYGFNLKKEDLYPPVDVHWVEVQQSIPNLSAFAQTNDLNYMQLKDYNVWLRDTTLVIKKTGDLPAKTYQIAIPKKEDLYFNKKRIQVHNPAWIH